MHRRFETIFSVQMWWLTHMIKCFEKAERNSFHLECIHASKLNISVNFRLCYNLHMRFFFELCWKCLQQTCEIHTLCSVVCHAQFCLLQRQRDDIANMPLYFGNNFPHIPFHFPSFHLIQILICFCFCIFVLIFCCCLFALAAAIIRFLLNIWTR